MNGLIDPSLKSCDGRSAYDDAHKIYVMDDYWYQQRTFSDRLIRMMLTAYSGLSRKMEISYPDHLPLISFPAL